MDAKRKMAFDRLLRRKERVESLPHFQGGGLRFQYSGW